MQQWRGLLPRRSTVVVIDDEELARTAVRHTLVEAGCEVVGEADSVEGGLRAVGDTGPDLVIIDIAFGEAARPQAIEQLSSCSISAPRVLVLTTNRDPLCLLAALKLGACGYILKDEGCDAILSAVHAAIAGQSVISSAVTQELVVALAKSTDAGAEAVRAADAIRTSLTVRELDILKRLASGEGNRKIADQLCLSEHTVKNHVTSILCKMKVNNRAQAAAHAARAGLLCLSGTLLAAALAVGAEQSTAFFSTFSV
jgi:DNA-binding NarL/FixJ family response regulator